MQEIEEELFIAELYNSLRGKIYLIVLDDVWSTDLWAQLQVALPEAKNGSRVLITTRFVLFFFPLHFVFIFPTKFIKSISASLLLGLKISGRKQML